MICQCQQRGCRGQVNALVQEQERESWSIAKWTIGDSSCCGTSALAHYVVKFLRNLGGGRSLVFLAGQSI